MNEKDTDFNDLNLGLPEKNHAFGLPSDYFKLLENKIKHKLELEIELNECPALLAVPKEKTYTTPLNYFKKAANEIEYNIELSVYQKLTDSPKLIQPLLDDVYVAAFEQSITNQINFADELKSFKTLYLIDKANSFNIPMNYFEDLAGLIKEKIHTGQPENNLWRETFLNFIFNKKTGFALACILVVGLFVFVNKQNTVTSDLPGDCKTLACLEKREILTNKTILNFDDEQLMELVDVASLNKQLNKLETPDTALVKKGNLNGVTDDDLLDEL